MFVHICHDLDDDEYKQFVMELHKFYLLVYYMTYKAHLYILMATGVMFEVQTSLI